MYLDQFKRGWSYTAVYLLRDRADEGGNQQFGFYRPDYTPRKAAVYLHNLTTILADHGSLKKPGSSTTPSRMSRRPCMICSCKKATARSSWWCGMSRSAGQAVSR